LAVDKKGKITEDSSKNILITVAGSTPQILTETLYNLVVQQGITISEIYVLTTTHGKEKMQDRVLKQNIIYRMFEDYDLQKQKIPSFQIKILKAHDGTPLNDVRSVAENEAAANQIIDFVKEKTFEENTRLFCSLAGGRKTMSSYMAIALNLFGRAKDELSHVLIYPDEREKDHDFFYPAPDDTRTRIDYARIPFIRLRQKLQKLFGDIRQLSYEELIKLTKLDLEDLAKEVRADLQKNSRRLLIKWGEKEFPVVFEPKLFAIYQFLFEGKEPQNIADNRKLEKLYKDEYGSGKEGKFDVDNIKKDVSSINHKFLEPSLPEFLYSLFKIKIDKEAVLDKYFIPLNFNSRNIDD